ncbi:MAG: hypothetical protein H6983_05120 [Ectothiorhodospiraceae bacterium]|nr:hypothetical protein [Ectothiorhodospiraceae bacterium]
MTRRPVDGPSLLCITRPELETTNRLLAEACDRLGVGFATVVAGQATSGDFSTWRDGRLLYRAATDEGSLCLERLLVGPDVACLHDPHFPCADPAARLFRAGLPMPRRVFVPARDHERLEAQAAWLGGFPVVVKRPGAEGGRGVSLVGSIDALVREVLAAPPGVAIEAFVPHARSYRLFVAGGRVLATTAATPGPGDFRTNAPSSRSLGAAVAPHGAEHIAVQAAAALAVDVAGVDLMESTDGTLLLTEANFPCYFADQQAETGVDLAGAIVRCLARKLGAQSSPFASA